MKERELMTDDESWENWVKAWCDWFDALDRSEIEEAE